MRIDPYTSNEFYRKNLNFSNIFISHFEGFLLSFIILLGLLGSCFVFNLLPNSDPNHNSLFNKVSSSALLSVLEESDTKEFDEYIKMPKKVDKGKDFDINFLQDLHTTRFVMEMGDGMRLIVTQPNLSYAYSNPGKYIVELKQMKDGLYHLIGTKEVKVK